MLLDGSISSQDKRLAAELWRVLLRRGLSLRAGGDNMKFWLIFQEAIL